MNPNDKEFENLNLYKDYTNITRNGRHEIDDQAGHEEEQENGHMTPQVSYIPIIYMYLHE